jgi:CubicO group peptidase (beta-lactamase class C family)
MRCLRLLLVCALFIMPLATRAEEAAPVTPAPPTEAEVTAAVEAKLAGLQPYIDKQLGDWKVPGLSVGIVKDGHIVYTRGFGERDREKQLPVTEHTVFPIGSVTKSFTVALLGMLVDEGKFDWDKPIRDYLPDFQVQDEYASAHITGRDLVTHRTGLPRHDAIWYGAPATRAQLMRSLRFLEPHNELRAAWEYNNLMYMAAGYAAEQITGQSYDDLLRQRLFAPLEMTSSNLTVGEMCACADYAVGYWELPGESGEPQLTLLPHDDIASMSPAGAINSNALDMCKYMQLQLGGGRFGDQQLLSAAQVQQMHIQQMAIPVPPARLHAPMFGYGMGWFVKPYNGRYMVYHGGNIDGYSANTALLPYERLGIVILTNKAGTQITDALNYYIIDRLLDWPVRDWGGELLAQNKAASSGDDAAQTALDADHVANTKPSRKLEDYAGAYEHPGYGIVNVTASGGKLGFAYNKFNFPLDHHHYDVFRVDPKQPLAGGLRVQFMLGLDGKVNAFEAQLEPAVEPLRWTRKPGLAAGTLLDSVVGSYLVGPLTVIIARKGEALSMMVPGQPVYDLLYAEQREFTVKQLPGYKVRFTEAGIELLQPDGTFKGEKLKVEKQ